jgi:DNA-binding CsgD family transcriptional regulator
VLRPFNWLEIGSVSSFTEDQKKVFYEAKEFGIASGGTVPIHGPGMAKALFTVASDRSQDEFGKLFKRHRHEIHIIATYAHEKILALGLLEKPEIDLDLTPRELEVLTWIARGKTRWEISEVLSISEETVKTHTEHACSKLGASNKTHASVVALVNGLIVP